MGDKIKKFQSVIVIFVLEAILALFSGSIIQNIESKEMTTYSLAEETYVEDYIAGGEEKEYLIRFAGSDIKDYYIQIINVDSWAGQLICEIRDEANSSVYCQVVDETYIRDQFIYVPLAGSQLKANVAYKLILSNLGNENIGVYVDGKNGLSNRQGYEFKYKKFFATVIIIVNILFVALNLFFLFYKNEKIKFLVVAIVTGIIMMFLIPPMTAPDEWRHFLRAYEIAQGHFAAEKTQEYWIELPVCDIPQELFELKLLSEQSAVNYGAEWNTLINFEVYIQKFKQSFSNEKVTVPFHGTASIHWAAYLPQVLFIWLAKLLHIAPIGLYYFARLGNVLCASFLAYWGFCLLPRYRNIYTVLYMAPGISFLRSTNSTDGFLYSLSLLLIAFILYLKQKEENIWKKGNIALVFGIIVIISLIKLPYILLVGVVLVLDNKQFLIQEKKFPIRLLDKGKKNQKDFGKQDSLKIKKGFGIKIIFIGIALAVGICAYKIGQASINKYIVHGSSGISVVESGQGLAEIIWKNSSELLQLFLTYFGSLYGQAIEYPVGQGLAVPFLIWGLYVASRGDGKKNLLLVKDKVYMFLLGLLIWMGIITIFLMSGGVFGKENLYGIQGRYMYPILPLWYIAFAREESYENKLNLSHVCMGSLAILGIYSLNVISRYWI